MEQTINVTPLVTFLNALPYKTIDGIGYAIWSYLIRNPGMQVAPSGQSPSSTNQVGTTVVPPPLNLGLAFSSRLLILDPTKFPDLVDIQTTRMLRPNGSDFVYVFHHFKVDVGSTITCSFVAPAQRDTRCTLRYVSSIDDGSTWQPIKFATAEGDNPVVDNILTGPAFVSQPSTSATAPAPLKAAARMMPKATYVPLTLPFAVATAPRKAALSKYSFVRRLDLQPGDVDAVSRAMSGSAGTQAGTLDPALAAPLKQFEGRPTESTLPPRSTFADTPMDTLTQFGRTLVSLRQAAVQAPATGMSGGLARAQAVNLMHAAIVSSKGLEANGTIMPVGMLNLEQLAMTPAGLQRGELLATIPLAPGERTSVVQKEWSVTDKEFTSIVTDSLEDYSEKGVTDNTELTQSTTSQAQHSNQFNVNATVSGGFGGIVTSSLASGFTSQGSNSQSATDSRKHATTLTGKASSRSKQEHKVTISTRTESGTAEATTRTLVNPSTTDSMRIDYFSIMRKWRVGLYRYGLRMTYDIALPEPGAAFREDYRTLAMLKQQAALGFTFPIAMGEITDAILPGESMPQYQVLAARYGASIQPPPPASQKLPPVGGPAKNAENDDHWRYNQETFDVPDKMQISDIFMIVNIGNAVQQSRDLEIIGYPKTWQDKLGDQHTTDFTADLVGYLVGVSGTGVAINYLTRFCDSIAVIFDVTVTRTPESYAQWQSDAWTALFNAAQANFYSNQQTVSNQIQDLENKINNVDTLTLRREEGDEIMKSVIRWLVGTNFEFMPPEVESLFKTSGADLQYGVGFTGNALGLQSAQWSTMTQFQELVKFINEAIEWENTLYFMYSYYWDVPESWDFIRQIQHSDSTRQAFLRSGSARVVLTVRKGFEPAWASFVELGNITSQLPPGHPYMTIANEIQAYDSTNYPGIPPASPSGTPPEQLDTAEAVCTTALAANTKPVAIPVDLADGFVVGMPVVIDTYESGVQETQTITAVATGQITVASLAHAHAIGVAGFPIVQPGESGVLMAEWFEYTPCSGTDIAVTSNLATIV